MTNILFAIGLTLLSGFSDALGFVHASRAWENDRFLLREAVWALVLFTGGIVTYILVIRYLHRLGVTAPEIQTLGWFAVTVIGVAVIQRTIVNWSPADRVMAVVAAISVGWLVVRQG